MEELRKGLWLGSDKDVDKAKDKGWARLCCCKEGPDSHRSMIGYTTLGAPRDSRYLVARKGDVMALNLIDVDDPSMIPNEPIDAGLKFIKEMQDKGTTTLVHCNQGHSRSPSIVLAYLHGVGGLPQSFGRAEHLFGKLYPPYDPGAGMRARIKERWNTFPALLQ
jgi:hypothetical protein